MDPKDVAEEHRKYLDMGENPKGVSNTSIFAMLSDGLMKLSGRMSVIETKQDTTHERLDKVDKKIACIESKLNNKVKVLEDDFLQCRTSGVGTRAENDERFVWIMRAIKLIIALCLTSIAMWSWHMGIPVFFP